MRRRPRVRSLLTCQNIVRGSGGLVTLVNVWNRAASGRFPFTVHGTHLFIEARAAAGPLRLLVELAGPAGRVLVSHFLEDEEVGGDDRPHEVHAVLPELTFPRPGCYLLRVRVQGESELLGERELFVDGSCKEPHG